MHAPKTVIGDFPSWGLRRWLPWLPQLLTLWHVDPETDGTDDSCGWGRPKLTKSQRSILSCMAGDEARSPWFQREQSRQPMSPANAESLLRGAIMMTAVSIGKRVTLAEATEWAVNLLHNPVDNVRGSLTLLAGWHTNYPEIRQSDRREYAERLFFVLAGYILRERRPWWREPRWHVRHWQLQIRPLQRIGKAPERGEAQ